MKGRSPGRPFSIFPHALALLRVFQSLDLFFELGFGDFFFRHFCQFNNVVHNLVFEDRRTQLLAHLRIVLDEFKELAFLTRVLTGLCHYRLRHLCIGDFDLGLLAKLCQQQTQTHAPLCQ